MAKAKQASLEQLRQKALDRRPLLSDEIVSSKTLFMDPLQQGRIIIRRPGGQEQSYEFDDRVYTQISSVILGLPGGYIEKLVQGENGDPGLAAMNFNHWINVNKDKEILCMFRKDLKTGERVLRAMKSSSWNKIPYDDTLAVFIAKYGPDKIVDVNGFGEDHMTFSLVTKKLDYKVNKDIHARRGDIVEWGIRFRDSDAGLMNATLFPYTMRLVCTNGAVGMSPGLVMSVSHTGSQSQLLQEALGHIGIGIQMVDGYAVKYGEYITAAHEIELAVNDETGYPESAIARLAKDTTIPQLGQKYIKEAWDVEGETIPEPSVWRLHNACSRAGTHAEELDEKARFHLQSVSGRVLELAGQPDYRWN